MLTLSFQIHISLTQELSTSLTLCSIGIFRDICSTERKSSTLQLGYAWESDNGHRGIMLVVEMLFPQFFKDKNYVSLNKTIQLSFFVCHIYSINI